MNSKLLTIKQAAEMLGITTQTMRRWDENGRFSSIRGKNNYRYYKKDDIENFIKNQKNFFQLAKRRIM